MDTKRVGITLLILGGILLVIFINSFYSLAAQGEQLGCFDQDECKPIERTMSYVHLGFGFFGFILALGFYLIFFSKGDQAILKHLQKEKKELSNEEKFSVLLMGLDSFEKRVVKAVRKQPGITQNTLRLRTDMSKAKLSQVLSQLEKKKLIAREPQKKTMAVHLSVDF